jgi:PIN domain nuclease of toxin-antitoxin system
MIFDASALLALMLGEPGADIVENHLAEAVISAVNYSEVIAKLLQHGMPFDLAMTGVAKLIAEVVPFEKEHAIVTAALREETADYGLSFADRACLALGRITRLPVLTADQAWAELKIKVRVELIR